jgi:hypothetical protein
LRLSQYAFADAGLESRQMPSFCDALAICDARSVWDLGFYRDTRHRWLKRHSSPRRGIARPFAAPLGFRNTLNFCGFVQKMHKTHTFALKVRKKQRLAAQAAGRRPQAKSPARGMAGVERLNGADWRHG